MLSDPPLPVLFVCLGNICRSPMAEAVFHHEATKRGVNVHVDSAGTGAYHVGEDPDERTLAVLEKHGVPVSCQARKVGLSDFKDFAYIFAMDSQNLNNLERLQPKESKARILLFSAFGDRKAISDPYYGGVSGFDKAYEQCKRYANEFLDALAEGRADA